ncbi:hypothetical protein PR202_ga20195 [Eleusine coracana subsp. coracana]|uniref:Myb/SANT-like DNA-binding domain-containing protein n=1 Tax=Eleusine coracana subsp. coracana TaxID=191504 RepID=A0AAV5CXJ1_ELECO|nr:hypothetical protein QOZ80_4AG0316110 [Eleusine coracana subsp. coracana]GJN02809.1 hypothetical protein PR202_ga20195 [Eleusine coracana subsp. coracana]
MDDDDDVSASPSPASSPAASALPVADPVTVAAAPPGSAFAVALPIQRTAASLYVNSSPAAGSGGGGREDAWSEGATSALIDAWGERFVALGRGSLRHPQWQEVADAVSSRDGYSKAPKSDVQCKNRIDTLKKKYKVERAKLVSSWQFFDRLDVLLAPTYAQKPSGGGGHTPNGRSPVPAALRVSFPQRSRTPLMPAAVKRREPSPEPSASSESSDGFPPPAFPVVPNGKRRRTEEDGGTERAQGLRELGLAIRRLGEAYERVETAKLEQAAEMERRRMEFARELESQRVQFFLNTQMELSQSKNHSSPARATVPSSATTVGGGGSRRMSMAADAGGSSNHHSRYRISHGDRHRHAPRQHYRYHDNSHAANVAVNQGEQTDEEDEEEESQ